MSQDEVHIPTPAPILLGADDISRFLTPKLAVPPPVPSPSAKPRKTSNAAMKAAVVVQVSPRSSATKQQPTNPAPAERRETVTDFDPVEPARRRRAVGVFGESERTHSMGNVTSAGIGISKAERRGHAASAPSLPTTTATYVDSGANGTAFEMPVSDEQAWHEFVVEENYSVLATKGILKRIAMFNQSHKSLHILKMQNAALDSVDRQNSEIHGMDAMEKAKEKKASSKGVRKMRTAPAPNRLGGDGDDFFSDEDQTSVGGGTSSHHDGPATTAGIGTRKPKRRKDQTKVKDIFKSDFLVKMKLQMKKHMNELWKRDYPRVRFSGRCHVHFLHGEPLERKKEYVSEVTFQNIGVRTAHMHVQMFGTSPRGSLFDLTAEPEDFEIPKGKKQVVKLKLVIHSSRAVVSEVIGVDVGWRTGSKEAKTKDKCNLRFPRRLCVYVSALGEPAVFGVPLEQVEMVPWASRIPSRGSGDVPRVLVELKAHLLSTHGLEQEGIFRKAPGDVETQLAKQALNRGTFSVDDFSNPQIFAHLIKVWFRELPDPVLQHTNPEQLILCKELSACQEIVDSLPPKIRTIFDWLLELMGEVVERSEVNLMNPANLGIVMGPNLLPNVDAADPMKALMLNKACTTFLSVLIKGSVQ